MTRIATAIKSTRRPNPVARDLLLALMAAHAPQLVARSGGTGAHFGDRYFDGAIVAGLQLAGWIRIADVDHYQHHGRNGPPTIRRVVFAITPAGRKAAMSADL